MVLIAPSKRKYFNSRFPLHIKCSSFLELVQNPKNNWISSQPIFSLPRKFEEKKKNTADELENPLVDLGFSLGKRFLFLDFYVIE